MSKKYDYLVVGAGLYGAVFAHEAKEAGKSVLVIDKRPNIAGNVFTEDVEGIHVHKYGAHIFHTNNKKVWNYITRFAEFNRFTNSPVANYHGELYSLPFNMYTFNKMWGVVTPEEARVIQKSSGVVTAKISRLLSSRDFRFVLHLITIILTHCIREFRLADIPKWLPICWTEWKFALERII